MLETFLEALRGNHRRAKAKPGQTKPNQAKPRAKPGWILRTLYAKTTEEPKRNQAKPSQTKGQTRLDSEEALCESQSDTKPNQPKPGQTRGLTRLNSEDALCGIEFLLPRPFSLLKF